MDCPEVAGWTAGGCEAQPGERWIVKPNTRPLVATLARSWVLLCALVCPAIALAQAGPPEDWSSVTTRIETDGSLGFAPAQAIFPDGFDVYTIGEPLGERAGSGEREGGAWVGGDGHPGWSAQ